MVKSLQRSLLGQTNSLFCKLLKQTSNWQPGNHWQPQVLNKSKDLVAKDVNNYKLGGRILELAPAAAVLIRACCQNTPPAAADADV